MSGPKSDQSRSVSEVTGIAEDTGNTQYTCLGVPVCIVMMRCLLDRISVSLLLSQAIPRFYSIPGVSMESYVYLVAYHIRCAVQFVGKFLCFSDCFYLVMF